MVDTHKTQVTIQSTNQLNNQSDMGAIAVKGSFSFSKAPTLLEPHDQIV